MGREEIVREAWRALSQGDWDAVAAAFAPTARWVGTVGGPGEFDGRARIVEVLQEDRALGLDGRVEAVTDAGERAILAFRPTGSRGGRGPLDDGLRYVVLRFNAEGLITEIKSCRDRVEALEYAAA